MRKRTIWTILLAVVLVCSLTAGLMACGDNKTYSDCVFEPNFDGLTEKPNETATQQATAVDAAQVTLSADKSADEAVRQSAAYLYNLANDNFSNVDFYASAAAGSGGSTVIGIQGNMSVRQRAVKDGETWFYEGYGMITSTKKVSDGGDSNLVGLVRSALDLCERVYTADGQTFYRQDCGNEPLKEDSLVNFLGEGNLTYRNEKGKPYGDFLTADQDKYYSTYYINNTHLENDNMEIKAEYLKDASIVYDEALGVYKVTMTVDPKSEAVALGSASLKKSSSASWFAYNYQNVTFEIWECGLMRTYNTDNSWSAKMFGFIEGTSENNFSKYFTYNRESVTKLLPTQAEIDDLIAICTKK